MDADLLARLEKLETKRRALNAQFDLTKECESIAELNQRVNLLSERISSIKDDVKSQSDLASSCCDMLGDTYSILRENSDRFELLSSLSQLNRLCKQIDHGNLSNNKELFLKVTREFEIVYKPLEVKLSARTDLPYADYANKLKQLSVKHSNDAIDPTST